MNDERLAELQEKYKDRNLLEELAWGIYYDHSGYTSKQNGEFLNWLCMVAYKALKERPQCETQDKKIEKIIEELESRKDYGVEYGQAMEDVIVILKAQFGIE